MFDRILLVSIISGCETNEKNGAIEATPATSNIDTKKVIIRRVSNLFFSLSC